MSTTTPNYNLVKPQDTDSADLKLFVGQNMDAIDTALAGKLSSSAIASATTLGAVKVGSGLSIDASGVLSASGGGGGGGSYLPLTGGDLTGPLTISGNRVQALDVNGSYTNPSNSCFAVTAAVDQSNTAGAISKLVFGTVQYDNQSEWDATNNRFTAKQAGTYYFSACMRLNNTLNNQVFLAFYKNGVADTRVQNFLNGGGASGNTTSAIHAHGSTTMKLNASDYVEVYGYTAVASTIQSRTSITGYDVTFFRGSKLS